MAPSPNSPSSRSPSSRLRSFDLTPDAQQETARLKALRRYDVLDTLSDDAYDDVAQLAAHLFDAPFAIVSLVDEDRQWFKSCIGLSERETGLETSFCARAIQSDDVLVIEDARTQDPFAGMSMVTGPPGIRFYAGAPLITPDGFSLGTLCVLDTTPRERPDDVLLDHLRRLARIVVSELELRRQKEERRIQSQTLRQVAQRAEVARASATRAQEVAEEARREAEAASQSKSRILSGIAHDIRSPISAISGFAQVLQRTLSAPSQTHAANILTATEQLHNMADTLSRLSRLESGRMTLERDTMDIRPLVDNVVTALHKRASTANIHLQTHLPESSVDAHVDPGALQRVVDNLTSNALKYCDAGDRVDVVLHPTSASPATTRSPSSHKSSSHKSHKHKDDTVCLEVRDTGPGIDESFIDLMYEPFTQASEDADGSGLGLAVTKELVDAMDGRIEATSEAGHGTTFSIFLPATPNGAT